MQFKQIETGVVFDLSNLGQPNFRGKH